MVYLFISILFSVSVGILFKLIKARTTINIFLIAVNYLCAIAATWIFFRPQIQLRAIPFNIYNVSLSILLPLVFILLSLSIRYSGIIKTDIAQRISLVIPIACSYWVFNETIPLLRWLGIVIGFIAMFFILNKAQRSHEKNAVFLLLVFLGYGIIDVLFKMVALQKSIPYTTALFYIFCGSFVVAAAITLLSFIKNKIVITTGTFFYGLLLGLFNFLNIYFYLKAHQYFSENPTTVFATMNFGVILLGTLAGAIYFKEKLSFKNILGLIMAVIAILLVVVSQLD
jgi:drug/metabolite transporter (DMT)-like permease